MPSGETRSYDEAQDDVTRVLADICESLATSEGVDFVVRGFGQDRWPVDVRVDLAVVVEQVPGVLSAELRGARDEAVEIIAEPMLMKSYGVSLEQLITGFSASNSLIAAGALEGPTGRFAVKVPGLIERPQDVLKIPMAASNGAAVTVGDVVQIKPTFKDPISVTRVANRRCSGSSWKEKRTRPAGSIFTSPSPTSKRRSSGLRALRSTSCCGR